MDVSTHGINEKASVGPVEAGKGYQSSIFGAGMGAKCVNYEGDGGEKQPKSQKFCFDSIPIHKSCINSTYIHIDGVPDGARYDLPSISSI